MQERIFSEYLFKDFVRIYSRYTGNLTRRILKMRDFSNGEVTNQNKFSRIATLAKRRKSIFANSKNPEIDIDRQNSLSKSLVDQHTIELVNFLQTQILRNLEPI